MSRRLAHLISWLLNPGCLVLGLLAIGVIATPLAPRAEWGWLAALATVTLVGGLILFLAWAHGVVIDVDLTTPSNLADRSKMLLIFLSLILVLLGASFALGAHQPLQALLVTVLVLGVFVALVTLTWKISLHMVGVGMFFVAVTILFGWLWWPIGLVIPIVAWARLHLVRHTPGQLLAGTLVGGILTSLVFGAYGLF